MDEELEVADLVKTERREAMQRHPAGGVAVDEHVAEDAHLDASYEDRFELTFDPLEMGEWYEEPWYEEE
jgi:hypothetical protein